MESLPPELCHQILRIAGGPPDDFDGRLLRWKPVTVLVDRLYLPKLRTAAQLVRVCKYWNEMVTPFLYENLIISTLEQLILVTATLKLGTDRRNDDSLGRLVKRIVIVPGKPFEANSTTFQPLVSRCPALTALHFARNFSMEPSLLTKVILQMASTLEVLNWGGTFLIESFTSSWSEILEKVTTLRALRLDFSPIPSRIPPSTEFLSICDHRIAPGPLVPSSVKELSIHCFHQPLHIKLCGTSITNLTLICAFTINDRHSDSFQPIISSIPPSVKALSLLLWSWDSIASIKSIPKNVTFLGLGNRGTANNFRPLVEFCEFAEAPALRTVQLIHWDDCEHLRKSRLNMSTKLASTLRKRNIDLIDWEGFLIV